MSPSRNKINIRTFVSPGRSRKGNKEWDYQQYNTPFKYDAYDRSEAAQKLRTKIQQRRNLQSPQQTAFYKGVNLKEFKKEVKQADAIDDSLFRKLRNQGSSMRLIII